MKGDLKMKLKIKIEENLRVGYETLSTQCQKLEEKNLDYLLNLYGKLAVLVYKAMTISDVAYYAQSLQEEVYSEIEKRINN